MRWQKIARLAIAAFVIVFAGFVFVAMRLDPPPKAAAEPPPPDKDALVQTEDGGEFERRDKAGNLQFAMKHAGLRTYRDGRNVLVRATIELPERDGRTFKIYGDEVEAVTPADSSSDLTTARAKGNVRITASDGLEVTSHEATYDGKTKVMTVPGPVAFTRGRLSGKGVGATYDQNRNVLWLLDQAQVAVAPDETGAGKLEASAATMGLDRSEHYMRLSKTAHVVSDDSTMDADDITALLTPDDQKVQTLQLRNNSRIVGTGSGAQSMSAKDIDLTYAEDGRTLQRAVLMEQGVLELPGAAGAAGRRITARTIDLGMAPDGSAVTQLQANDGVVLDLPPQGETPAKRITSRALSGTSGSGQGLETLTFEGPVEYRETLPAHGAAAAVDRTVNAIRLIVQTKPGLGDLQTADFRGNAKIIDGQTTAEAPRALYQVAQDRIDLSPSGADPGPPPTVTDGQITVQARAIELTMSTHALRAETDVRSILQRKPAAGQPAESSRLPSMLKQDEPVTITANRLDYDRAQSRARYTGAARLTQGRTEIRADNMDLDEKSGNLATKGHTRTKMLFEDVNPKTKQKTLAETIGTSDTLDYQEAKRLAIYTAGDNIRARLVGPQGDMTGDRIELFLKEGGSELERAEAYGETAGVFVIEGLRTAKGRRLTYTTADDTYVMTGTPVDVMEPDQANCKQTRAATVKFSRTDDRIETLAGIGLPVTTTTIPGKCPEQRN